MTKVSRTVTIDRFWIFFCIAVALFLRLYRLNTDLLIHFDQGLHAYGAWQIWHEHKIKLLGHMTDTDGINHGPYFYMLLSVPYALSNGSPVAASFFLILLEVLSFYFLYHALVRLFDRDTARAALLIISVSYGAVYFSRWLSNVTPIMPLTNLGLYLATDTKKKRRNIKIALLGIIGGLIAQMNGAVGLVAIPSLMFLARPKKIESVLYLFCVFLVQIPLIAFDLRHDFVMTRAIFNFAGKSDSGFVRFGSAFIPTVISYFRQNEFYLARGHFFVGIVLYLIGMFYILKKRQFALAFYLVLGVLTFGMMARGGLGFFFSYCFVLMTTVCIYGLKHLGKTFFLIGTAYFAILNLAMLSDLRSPTNGLTPIGTNSLITVQDRKNVVDYIYTQAHGEPFAIWIYTIPYFLDQPWTYFFDWYGNNKYGYLPEKTGSFSPGDLKEAKRVFVIYEPDLDNPNRLKTWQNEVEINFGPMISSYRSDDAIVELRSYGKK